MFDNKERGELPPFDSHNRTYGDGDIFGGGINPQIAADIETQIQSASRNLQELQFLKVKLEEERRINVEKARLATELENAKRIAAENERLKDTLQRYQVEINSLKQIIRSLNNDLAQSAQQFQLKVADSLKILQKTEVEIETMPISPVTSNIINFGSLPGVDPHPAPFKTEPPTSFSFKVPATENSSDSPFGALKASVLSQQAAPAPAETMTTFATQAATSEPVIQPASALASEPVAAANYSEAVEPQSKTETDGTTVEDSDELFNEYRLIEQELDSLGHDDAQSATVMPIEPAQPTPISQAPAAPMAETFWPSKPVPAATPVKSIKDNAKDKRAFLFFKKKDKNINEAQTATNVVEKPAEKAEEKKSSGGIGKLAVKVSILLILASGGGITYRISNAEKLREVYTSQAKAVYAENTKDQKPEGVPDEFASNPIEVKYREAYVDAPFEDTVWNTYRDPEVGIKIDYPKNTSYKLKPIGSSNIWFLRKDGFLVKIEKTKTTSSLEQFLESQNLTLKYNNENVTFANRPALRLTLDETTEVPGNIYYVKTSDSIFKIWYRTFYSGENPDDEQRVNRMMESIEFIGADTATTTSTKKASNK